MKSDEANEVSTLDDLLEPFHQAEKPRARFRIGTEMEKIGVLVPEAKPLPYEGDRGVAGVFARLVRAHGWFEEREHAGGDVISLRRGDASITLEPGAQLELSGAPQETIHQTCAELRGHMAELSDISKELGIAWLGLGYHPFASEAELPWVPKLRYAVMKKYLPTRGPRALEMMLRTATVQANLDFESEADAMRKLRVSLRLAPIVCAMFANSPFREGKKTGGRSWRAQVWLEMDPDRSGLLPFAWRDDATYLDYVEWALDVPMFLVKRGGKILENTGQTFRAFMKDGYSGARATTSDWETHVNSLFPEARLKRTLEVRSADSQSQKLVCALPALWKGLLYSDDALARVDALTAKLTHADAEASRPEIVEKALHAKLAGRELAEWASEVLAIAEDGLARLAHLDRDGRDERIHLARLKELVASGRSPADVLLEQVEGAPSLTEAVLAHALV